MWQMSVPWWEFVVRGIVVFLFLLVFMRLTGKRQTGQYAGLYHDTFVRLARQSEDDMPTGQDSA